MKKKAPIKRRDILRLLSGAAVAPIFPFADWMLSPAGADQPHAALALVLGHLRDRTTASRFSAYTSLLGNFQLIRG